QRRASRDEAGAQRTDADPGAAGELEIFGNTAVEVETLGKIAGHRRLRGIAELVETFFVEGSLGEFALTPIARRDIRSPDAQFELAVAGRELDLVAKHRKPDMSGAAGARRRRQR